MKTTSISILLIRFSALLVLPLGSCGNYEMTTPVTTSQQVSAMKGYPALSGKPALRVPATIGVFTTGRTDSIDFGDAAAEAMKGGQIRSMQSINSFVPNREYYQLHDVIAKRAKLIHDTRFLGLDLILICDQETDSDRSPSLVGIATLGIVDAGMRKQNTQLTVLCMDARTGYVYGVMGRQEDGRTPRLALFHADVFGDSKRSHLVHTTRSEAVKGFPKFWSEVVQKYSRRR